jgi:hypothetical protein
MIVVVILIGSMLIVVMLVMTFINARAQRSAPPAPFARRAGTP